ncbi:hypothetical protein GCM10023149_30540 [Mucilaginibacter gynuensis]|uniref:Uncharacterized protein n=1 Tax=Mucilaginibacter gynuensis TaxID=1302236 RepID=A0ABP8GMT8_9SPHI
MNEFDQLRTLWQTADTSALPDSQAMLRLVRKFRNQKLQKKWLVIGLAVLFSLLITAVLCLVHFQLPGTYIGGALMTLSGILLAITNLRSLKRFYRLNDYSNAEFLAFIEQTRRNQVRYYQKTMVWIVALASIGWFLYLYETVAPYPEWLAGTYCFAFAYICVLWFIVRPRAFRRDARKLDALRQKIENISKQLT